MKKPCKCYKDYLQISLAKCEENLLTETDLQKQSEIQRHIHRLKDAINKGINKGHNSIRVPVSVVE
jgi:hypothetical protein